MKLTLATSALLLTAGAAFAQGTTGATNGATTGPTGTSTPPAVMAPPMTSPAPAAKATNPVVQTPGASVNTTAQSNSSPSPSAVQTHDSTSRTSAAPVPGRNSFTLGQARRRITDAGFSDVKDLKKDGQGIWRGQATKDGASVKVALDYQGNVVAQ